jgi:hypothetical protein
VGDCGLHVPARAASREPVEVEVAYVHESTINIYG